MAPSLGIWDERLKELDPPELDGASGSSGYTPLHYAARAGHAAAAHMLLDAGADPNRVTAAGGATSLHRAAYMGHTCVVRLLLQRGADAALQDADGETALHKAASQGHQDSLIRTSSGAVLVGRDGAERARMRTSKSWSSQRRAIIWC
ncbi:hypothetical protein WJX81_001485 [Elliptochloris bilobata]|uniref:Uncharacterized protein n=1 Tax=Elliptochloris bilobata TaxID=381761 RepID=A0AAW1S643_9CHLO